MDQFTKVIQDNLETNRQVFITHHKIKKDLQQIITSQLEQIEQLEGNNTAQQKTIEDLTTSIRSCKNYYRSRYETCDCDRELCIFCEWKREDTAFRLEMETNDSNKRKYEELQKDSAESQSNQQNSAHPKNIHSSWSKFNKKLDRQEKKRNKKSI